MPGKNRFLGFCLIVFSSTLMAGKPVIENVTAECNPQRLCKFEVTLRHADEGWSHYANGWEVLTPAGELLGHRVLAHPHVNEQPFTRSLRNIAIPPSVNRVVIRAYDSKHGSNQKKYVVQLNFEAS